MNDRNNTIAGWVLGAGIIALGASIVTGEVFHSEAPEKGGLPIEGAAEEGGAGAEADKPIAVYLASADVAKGEATFKKCTACHNADQGGANALGPNLWGVLGEPIGKGANGFAFSDALASKGGNWDWESLNQWLKSPKAFAPGTKMTFAGLSNPQDRADVIAFLNSHGSNLPLPAAPAADAAAPADAAAAAGDKAAAENGVGADAQKAPDTGHPDPAKAGQANPPAVHGEGAPEGKK